MKFSSAERLDKFRNELGEQRQLREARLRALVSRVPIYCEFAWQN